MCIDNVIMLDVHRLFVWFEITGSYDPRASFALATLIITFMSNSLCACELKWYILAIINLLINLVASLMPPTLFQSADDKSLGMSVGVFGIVL